MQQIKDRPVGFRKDGTLVIYDSSEEIRQDKDAVRFWCSPPVLFQTIQSIERELAEYEDLEGEDPITSMEALEYGILLQNERHEEDKRSEIHLRASFVAGDASQRKLWDDYGGCW
jgi:hypothetical protein